MLRDAVALGEARSQHIRKRLRRDRVGNKTAYWKRSEAVEVVGLRVFWGWGESSVELELARGARAQRGGRRTHGDRAGSGRTGKSSIQNAHNSRVLFLSKKTTH